MPNNEQIQDQTRNQRTSLNYENIINTINLFKRAGTRSGGDFNLYDTPGYNYFKLLFYFTNGDSEGNCDIKSSSGLLAPTWKLVPEEKEQIIGDKLNNKGESIQQNKNQIDYKQLYNYNSAWSYLIINDEIERANQLKQFVSLLSNINSTSPWYFTELSGLDAALERKAITDHEFKIEEQRQKISIKCREDSFDERIGTLLDLYRSIVWSNTYKREILPANLRKFDMGIYIFQTPTIPIHHHFEKKLLKTENTYSAMDEGSLHQSSYKYIELHNCEFDYNSSKSAYTTFDNKEGTQMEYTIDIYFDDCFERRFNEFELSNIGDMISLDLNLMNGDKIWNFDVNKNKLETQNFNDFYKNGGFLQAALEEGKELIKGKIKQLGNHIYLGNLYSFSIAHALDNMKKFSEGQLIQTGKVIKSKVKGAKNRRQHHVHDLGNLFKSKTIVNNI